MKADARKRHVAEVAMAVVVVVVEVEIVVDLEAAEEAVAADVVAFQTPSG